MIQCRNCDADGEDIFLVEHWQDHTIEFDQNADGTISPEGYLQDGSPYKVVAHCGKCGHHWKLRRVLQITNLPIRHTPGGTK